MGFLGLMIIIFSGVTWGGQETMSLIDHRKKIIQRDILIDQIPWHIESYEKEDIRPKVLLMPGAMLGSYSFSELLQDASARNLPIQLFVAYPPGQGPQKFSDSSFHPRELANLTRKFIQETGPYDLVVGHSLSANILLEMARQAKTEFPILAISPSFYYSKEHFITRLLAAFPKIFYRTPLYRWNFLVKNQFAHFFDPSISNLKLDGLVREAQEIIRNNPKAQERIFRELYRYYQDIETEELPIEEDILKRKNIYFLRAKNDLIFASSEFLDRLLERRRLFEVEIGGHSPMISVPEEINDIILTLI